MAKVKISTDQSAAHLFDDLDTLAIDGHLASYRVISSDAIGLALWRHELESGASIRLTSPMEDHAFYVVSGEISSNRISCGVGSAIGVAQGGSVELTTKAEHTSLIHFIGEEATRPHRPGGCVHIMPDELPLTGERNGFRHTIYMDSGCPNCAMWLHKTRMIAGQAVPPHYHTENEIISVLHGQLETGTRTLPSGGAIAIAEHVIYSFKAGTDGLCFLNFRQDEPFALKVGQSPEERMSERHYMQAMLEEQRGKSG